MKGVIYSDRGRQASQLSPFIDLLSDAQICSRDIPYLQKLGINMVLVENIDESADHSACMELLAQSGIYVLVDVFGQTSHTYLENGTFATPHDYAIFEHIDALVDQFHKYPNTLGFQAHTNFANSQKMPLYKVAVKYMKQLLHDRQYRNIPIGFAYQYQVATHQKLL
jgi:Glucanosyltransferase